MNISLKPGSYVVAVSGGVDSVVLLHMLQTYIKDNSSPWKLTVAHYDHGIREDSTADRGFVQELTRQYGLPFVYDEGHLGANASEATARENRYKFLHQVRQASGARAIVTAHHQDDVLETAIINILRGTGRKGITALANTSDIARPLLHMPKRNIIAYAKEQGLQWHEDSTNQDETYLRNHVRHRLLPRFDDVARERLLEIITAMRNINQELDTLLVKYVQGQSVKGVLDHRWFNGLSHSVAREVLATWLRAHDVRTFDTKTLERLVVVIKTARPGASFDVIQGVTLKINKDDLALTKPER